jgi:FkbM family methyltransferase
VVHGRPWYHKIVMQKSETFEPPFTVSEWLKFHFVPAGLYARYLVNKNLRKGEAELHLLPDIVPRDRVAIDVGANKGVYTHLLANLTPHVHAFEPNPKAYRWLTRALPANVTAHRIALSDKDGDSLLYVPKHHGGYSNQHGSLREGTALAPHGAVPTATRTLDSCALTNVGFIKIDVEGFEAEVLAGAQGTIHQSKPVLLIEIEEQHTGRPLEDSIGDVTGLGYKAHFVDGTTLTPLSAFDPEQRHRAPRNRADYVFNFIFLPN